MLCVCVCVKLIAEMDRLKEQKAVLCTESLRLNKLINVASFMFLAQEDLLDLKRKRVSVGLARSSLGGSRIG